VVGCLSFSSKSGSKWQLISDSGTILDREINEEIHLSDERIVIATPVPHQGESVIDILDSKGRRLKGFTPFKTKNHVGALIPQAVGRYIAYPSFVDKKTYLNILDSQAKPLSGYEPIELDSTFVFVSK
jgi:hypothetical protein